MDEDDESLQKKKWGQKKRSYTKNPKNPRWRSKQNNQRDESEIEKTRSGNSSDEDETETTVNDEIRTNYESLETIQRRESGGRKLRPWIDKSRPQMSKEIDKDKR